MIKKWLDYILQMKNGCILSNFRFNKADRICTVQGYCVPKMCSKFTKRHLRQQAHCTLVLSRARFAWLCALHAYCQQFASYFSSGEKQKETSEPGRSKQLRNGILACEEIKSQCFLCSLLVLEIQMLLSNKTSNALVLSYGDKKWALVLAQTKRGKEMQGHVNFLVVVHYT